MREIRRLPRMVQRNNPLPSNYWGYTVQRDGGSMEYRLAHVPWHGCMHAHSACFSRAMLRRFTVPNSRECWLNHPIRRFLQEGSAVQVMRGVRI